MRLEFDIARRLSFSSEQRAFTRWVSIFSALGMAVGVAALITVLSVMNGLGGELTGRLLRAIPHVEFELEAQHADVPALTQRIEREWAGAAAAPFINRQVMLRTPFSSAGAELSGYDSEAAGLVDLNVLQGSLKAVVNDRYHLALGDSLAQQLGVGVGDRVDVVIPSLSVTPMGVLPRYRAMTVSAIVAVGASPDAVLALSSFGTIQRLIRVTSPEGIRIRLSDPEEAGALALHLRESGLVVGEVTTWADSQRSLFAAIKMEKILVSILLSALIAIAAFSVVSSLTMSVSEKRSDIASLRVLGLTPYNIRNIFLIHGLMLAIMGITFGTCIGLILVLNLESLMQLLERLLGWTLFDPSVYYIGGLPTQILITDIFSIVAGAVFLSIVAASYPAVRASRISPVSALEGLRT